METRRTALLLALPGFVALLAEPLHWLIETWLNSFYGSSGFLVALACVVLLVASVRSGPAPSSQPDGLAVGLLIGAALLRLLGRVLAVNLIGALALCLDLWALGLLLRVQARPWPLQPAALGLLFFFSMPAERLLQRVLGHPLRLGSGVLAESVLGLAYDGLQRAGTLLSWNGLDLEIDLPCSGARGLLLLCTLGAALACRRSPTCGRLLVGGLAVVAGALLANTTRIVLLFAGTAAGWPVLHEPWHGLLGLLALGLGSLPLLACAQSWPCLIPVGHSPNRSSPAEASGPERAAEVRRFRPRNLPAAFLALEKSGPRTALAFSLIACAIALMPGRPLDLSRTSFQRNLPANLGPAIGQHLEPGAQERAYFGQFGGSLQKRAYRFPDGRTHTVLLVTSSAPLRHLHEPEECLSYAGFQLEPAGLRPGRLPTVQWKATGSDALPWRVEVTYADEAGRGAAYLSEVVWYWLRRPTTAWSLIERVSAWPACEADPTPCRDFDRALFSALDLSLPEEST